MNSTPQPTTPSAPTLLAQFVETLRAERETWTTWLAERAADGHTSLVGEPFVVACDAVLGLRLRGSSSEPVRMKPGLCGVSHFTRESAAKVATLRGAPYRVVAAADIPALRIAEIDAALKELTS